MQASVYQHMCVWRMAKKQTLLDDFLTRQQSEQSEQSPESSDIDSDCASAESDTPFNKSAEVDMGSISLCVASGSNVILSKPNQPRCQSFPSRLFGKQKRSFHSKWFDNEKWSSWLHWDGTANKAFCYICRNLFQLNQIKLTKNVEAAFIVNGFDN